MKAGVTCPACGKEFVTRQCPIPTDEDIHVRRKNPPHGWAIPGGFVEYGERTEDCAVREALEETGLEVTLKEILGVYSDPARDPRFHTISVVYLADAGAVGVFAEDELPAEIVFDHGKILADYFARLRTD